MKSIENLYNQFMSSFLLSRKLGDFQLCSEKSEAMLTKNLPATAILWGAGFLLLELILIYFVDKPLAAYTNSLSQTSPALINFFDNITDIGKAQWYLWPCGIATIFCFFLWRGKDVTPAFQRLFAYIGVRTLFLFGAISFSGIIANIIKLFLGRARPFLLFRDGIYGFAPLSLQGHPWHSMPSGHTVTVFTIAFSLSILYPRLRLLWLFCAILLATSRVMINAHYLSDVFAGVVLAWLSVHFIYKYGMILIHRIIFPIDILPVKE